MQFEVLDILPFLEEFFCECEIDIKYRERKLEFETRETSPIYVSIDVKHMLRVLDNLYSNALKYSHEGDCIILKLEKGTDTVSIRVSDNGIGISPDELDKIFERSYMVDKARTPDSKRGFGLGLSICREIVELHHGSISCTGSLGEGSSFIFTLPVFKEEGSIEDNKSFETV